MFPACQGHIVGQGVSVLDLKRRQREWGPNRPHVREIEQGQALIQRAEGDSRDTELHVEVAIEVLLQVSGIHTVVAKTGLVSRARVENVGVAEGHAGVKIVVESRRSL